MFQKPIYFICLLLFFSFTQQNTKNSNESLNTEKQPSKQHNQHENFIPYIILFLVLCLFIGNICKVIKEKTSIPYSPQLLIFGMILGCYYQQLGDIGIATDYMLNINPHSILYIFIPTIIFESSYNIDPFVFKKSVVQINILAIFGVIIGAILIGFCFYVLLNYGSEFSLSACLSFSAIICATDPVAVVALLKELGTNKKFNVLLEGESLFNDGTAAVFYIIFSNIYKGLGANPIQFLTSFIRLFFGGILVGIIVCFFIVYWLKGIIKDDIMTLAYTFIGCYFTFLLSEYYLGVSGIISIVTLGILMGIYGKTNINPSSEVAIHNVWSFVQHTLETILFIITGMYVGKNLLSDSLSTINSHDVIKVFIFFLLMTFARFLMIYLLWGMLNNHGWPINIKDIIVLTYGGLRGAIALALSLLVAIDPDFSPRFQDIVLFYTTSMIFMTILFNGLTMKYVMGKINFQPVPEVKKKIREGLEKQLLIETYQQKSKIVGNKFLKQIDWYKVVEQSGMLNDYQKISKRQEKQLKIRELELQSGLKENLVQDKSALLIETRFRFYQLLKQEIWNHFEQSLCEAQTVRELLEMVDLTLEETSRPVWIWECVSDSFLNIGRLKNLLELKDIFLLGYFVKKFFIQEVMHQYEILQILVQSLKNIENTKKTLPIQMHYVQIVFSELQLNLRECEMHLFHFMELFPQLSKGIQEKNAAKMLLNTQKGFLEELLHDGSITQNEFETLIYKIDSRIKFVQVSTNVNDIQKIDELLLICPIFKYLTESQFSAIQKDRTFKLYKKNETILQQDKISSGLLCIKQGTVVETDNKDKDQHNTYGIGSIIFFGNLINPSGSAISTITAITDVNLIYIPYPTIINIQQENQNFNQNIYKQAAFDLYQKYQFGSMNLNDNTMQFLIDKSEYREYEKNTFIEMKNGGFLFSGQLKIEEEHQEVIFKEICFVPTSETDYQTLTDVKLLKFQLKITSNLEEQMRVSQKASFNRDSFASVINLEQDIDRKFNILQKKIIELQKINQYKI